MTSKEEKLAAARRKLKEFQGKNKVGDKAKKVESSLQDDSGGGLLKEFSRIPSQPCLEHFPVSKEIKSDNEISLNVCDQKMTERNLSTSVPFFKKSQVSEENQGSARDVSVCEDSFRKPEEKKESKLVSFKPSPSDFFNKADSGNTSENLDFNLTDGTRGSQNNESSFENIRGFLNGENPSSNKSLDLHGRYSITESALNDVVKPLQIELQNHAQTISILVQQRNEAQIAANHAEKLLANKSEEVEMLNQDTARLKSSLCNLNERLSDAEKIIEKLKFEKEKDFQKLEDERHQSEALKAKYGAKEEECLEMKRKFEEKSKECQMLSLNLNDVQSQLSLCQIQLQQFSSSGNTTLTTQILHLQNENESLRQQIEDFKKQIEVTRMELENSSQNFHVYAQQCNSQLSSLNSQVMTLKLDNQKLVEENTFLKETSTNVETENKTETFCERCHSDRAEHLSADKLNELENKLHDKEEKFLVLLKELEEKNVALKNLENILKALETENKKLTIEAETPKANERLLAIMESDKVAAAKAVSQNLKLKEQIGELEKAFMKLSQEKLELTDQLDHEKHVTAELQKQINDLKKDNCDNHDDHDHRRGSDSDHHCHNHDHDHGHVSDSCHHHEQEEPLVNDSNEVEELRSIVRQLQDDKIELKARLNSLRQEETMEKNHVENKDHEAEDEKQCENTKALLRMMEEKVRKTMNEIAFLDEEKEKLEHLVLQLQGETETIGEYVALYQKQRMMLRQRAREKDMQLMQLSKDKEELRCKLASLDELVKRLLAEKQNVSIYSDLNSAPSVVPPKTVDQIRDLLSEIGSSRLIDSNSIAFEHCSCCSGRLITV